MIFVILRNGFRALRRDRGALVLAFVLPIAFFSIFALVFGGMSSGTPRVDVAVVDQDHSSVSNRLVDGLSRESSLRVHIKPDAHTNGGEAPASSAPYTAATAERAVRDGSVPAAIIIPKGFGEHPIAFRQSGNQTPIAILHDSSDPIAAQVVNGMLQKVVMTSLPDAMASEGTKYLDRFTGGLTTDQRSRMDSALTRLRDYQQRRQHSTTASDDGLTNGLISVSIRDVVGGNKSNPMVAFYAAGIGVMFLLFTASSAAGSLIDEAESGALDRLRSARVSMTTLLAGKLAYSASLASLQLVAMFLWGAAVFHLDLFSHLPGFVVMTVATALAAASFGMVLATLSRTRPQQAAISTLLILTMSALGGSMFPRFLMPPVMKAIGQFTFNAWAIDGFTKVFWRDLPVVDLLPQVAVLAATSIILFTIARLLARRWEVG
ncbi:MAG TPA: ABC transporter permease [Rhizomicrobium sp.]|jgi:ABC-2 type transport system permease protein